MCVGEGRGGGVDSFPTVLYVVGGRPPLHPWFGLFTEDVVGALGVTMTPAASCLFFESAVHVHNRTEHTESWSGLRFELGLGLELGVVLGLGLGESWG